jgi:hypothetical protein
MATTRRKTPGFIEKPKVTSAEVKEEILLDETTVETPPEEITPDEAPVPVPPPVPMPVVIESIVPTEDAGPRFVEKPVEVVKQEPTPEIVSSSAPVLPHPPKRHPRNIPKYSRHKKS